MNQHTTFLLLIILNCSHNNRVHPEKNSMRYRSFKHALVLTILLAANSLWAQPQGTATIILENVVIPNMANPEEDRVVNLIIKDGLLDIVTESGIPDEPGVPAYDAENGVLIGRLTIGQPAAFLILGQDPREKVEVLLDTKQFGDFAIAGGAVERNRLREVVNSDQRGRGWFSYTPPPISLPTRYESQQKWNYYQGENFRNLFTATMALDRTTWSSQDSTNLTQVGDLEAYNGGEIRALRFGVIGAITRFRKPWLYTVFGATTAFDKGFDDRKSDSFVWFDYRLDIPVFEKNTIAIGKQKEPINMERMTSLIFLPFQERSAAADTFLPSRNIGAVISGTQLNQRLSWATGVFNDWLESGDSRSDSATTYTGRVTGIPFSTKDESNLLHLGFGYRYSDAKEGLRTSQTPETTQAPDFLASGFIDQIDNSQTFNYELSWRQGPNWLHGEYLDVNIQDSSFGDLNFSGYHVSFSRILTGEMRSYNHRSGIFNRLQIARPVNQNGWGAWEVGVRYSHTDLADGPVQGCEMDIWTLGLNWWLRSDIMTSLNWRHVELDQVTDTAFSPVSGQSSGWTYRVLLILD